MYPYNYDDKRWTHISMNPPPADVFSSFAEALKRKGIVGVEQGEYLKWLRFYWDFCSKYRHPPREGDSLEPFL